VEFLVVEFEVAAEDERIFLPVTRRDEGAGKITAEGIALQTGGVGVPGDDLFAGDGAFGAAGGPEVGDVGEVGRAGVGFVLAVGFATFREEGGFFVVFGDVEGAEEDLEAVEGWRDGRWWLLLLRLLEGEEREKEEKDEVKSYGDGFEVHEGSFQRRENT